MKCVLFYINGHGFGHATRIIEVINELAVADVEIFPLICTDAPEGLFENRLTSDFEYVHCDNGFGTVQKGWMGVDKLETLKRCAEFIHGETRFTRAQVAFARQNEIRGIISDIPSTAFVIAQEAGIPSFGISNFSWDWIYSPYVDEYPEYRFVVEHIRLCYSSATRMFRLPFCGDLSAFPVVEDIPLIARTSSLERAEIFRRLGISPKRKLVIVYLGQYDSSRVVVKERSVDEKYVIMHADSLHVDDLTVPDLLKAADVVVTKPGYGIVSECIASRTPILYCERQDFREYDALVEGIGKYGCGHLIPRDDFLTGTWIPYLEEQLATECEWPAVAVNGSEIAAKRILELI